MRSLGPTALHESDMNLGTVDPSVKRRKLWKMGEDGLCCSSRATQTRLGPSSLLEEWSEIPSVFVVSFVLSATPQTGGNGQGI